jgi:hypothetical protein
LFWRVLVLALLDQLVDHFRPVFEYEYYVTREVQV